MFCKYQPTFSGFLRTLNTFFQNNFNNKFSKMVEFSKFQKNIRNPRIFSKSKLKISKLFLKSRDFSKFFRFYFCNFPIQHLINCFVRSMFLCSLQKEKLNQINFRIMWEFLENFEWILWNVEKNLNFRYFYWIKKNIGNI